MALQRLVRSRSTRILTIGSLVLQAKRSFENGRRARGAVLLVVAALAWKWALLGIITQGVVRLIRGGGGSPSSPQ